MNHILKAFFLTIPWVSSVTAAEIPKSYSMKCWDGTFMYNELAVQSHGDQLTFKSSSQSTGIYSNLIPIDQASVAVSATFSVPKKNCRISATDPKILSCESDSLLIQMNELAFKPQKNHIVEKKNVSIQIRRVQHNSQFIDITTGYELSLSSIFADEQNPILKQPYFYDFDEDGTNNCTLLTQ